MGTITRLLLCLALSTVYGVLSTAPAAAADDPSRAPVDRAVSRALEFLHRTRDDDGAWRAGRSSKHPAITALAVMAFLSAGHVPGEGPYGDAVERGVRWVMQGQHANGLIASEGHHEMYHHGICTLMLAEVAGMTDGRLAAEVRQRLEKAVALILKAQRATGVHKGGW